MAPALIIVGALAAVALFWPKKGKKGGNGATQFPGVPDSIAYGAIGLAYRAVDLCPAKQAQIEDASELFASHAAEDPEAQFRAFAMVIADLCPGATPIAADVELGAQIWGDALAAGGQ